MAWQYEYAGLSVSSEIEIPEWAEFERAAARARADVSIFLKDASVIPPLSILTGTECAFFLSAIGTYQIRAGREIFVTPLPETGARELRLFLLGTAWGILCYQRGVLLLHASVVRAGDGAIAFCGSSGAGKSSLAAALIERGAALISDDLCRVIFPTDDQALVYPSAPRLKLWNDALENFSSPTQELERDHFRMDKFHVPLHEPIDLAPAPLRALYLLDWGDLEIERLRGTTALQRLMHHATYRSDLLEPMGIVAEHWARLAELIRRVPVFTFARPKDWSALEETIAKLGIL